MITSGCGPSVPAGKVRVPGTVTFDGHPLAADIVTLASTSTSESGAAKPDSRGRFELILSPGAYAVAVVAKDGTDTMDEDGTPILALSHIPERYERISTSGLHVVVTPDGQPIAISIQK